MTKWKEDSRDILNNINYEIKVLRDILKKEKDESKKISSYKNFLKNLGSKLKKFFLEYDNVMNSEISFFFIYDIEEFDVQIIITLLEDIDFSSEVDDFPTRKYQILYDTLKYQSVVSLKILENEKMYSEVRNYSKLNKEESKSSLDDFKVELEQYKKHIDDMEKETIKIQKRIKKFHETSISILGFFTAIVFTVFGGLDMISKIFDKVSDPSGSNIALLILSGVMIFLVMLLTVNFLLVTIGRLSGNSHSDFKYNVSFKKINYEISYVRVLFYLSLIISLIIFVLLGVNKFHKDSNAMVFDFILLPAIAIMIIILVIVVIKIFMKNKKKHELVEC